MFDRSFEEYLQEHVSGVTLDLSQTDLDYRDLRGVIEFLQKKPEIEILDLSGNSLGDVPSGLLTHPSIQEIDLSNILDPIKKQRTLPSHIFNDLGKSDVKIVKMNEDNVTDSQLEALLRNNSLKKLELKNNNLSQAGENKIKEFNTSNNLDLGYKPD